MLTTYNTVDRNVFLDQSHVEDFDRIDDWFASKFYEFYSSLLEGFQPKVMLSTNMYHYLRRLGVLAYGQPDKLPYSYLPSEL